MAPPEPEADAGVVVAELEPLVAEAELDPVEDVEEAIEAKQCQHLLERVVMVMPLFLTDGLSCCGAGARKGAHSSVGVATT